MTIVLGDPLKPVWLDLGDDVRLLTNVHDPVCEIAEHQAYTAELASNGGDHARARLAALIAMAQSCVTEWQGVEWTPGTAAPFTPENLARLFSEHRGIAITFGVRRAEALEAWTQEKKGSSPSSNGISTAPASAKDASPGAKPAPTPSKRRSPERARPSGVH
jgi:hypothetical protein